MYVSTNSGPHSCLRGPQAPLVFPSVQFVCDGVPPTGRRSTGDASSNSSRIFHARTIRVRRRIAAARARGVRARARMDSRYECYA
jgi:hypothetical protein